MSTRQGARPRAAGALRRVGDLKATSTVPGLQSPVLVMYCMTKFSSKSLSACVDFQIFYHPPHPAPFRATEKPSTHHGRPKSITTRPADCPNILCCHAPASWRWQHQSPNTPACQRSTTKPPKCASCPRTPFGATYDAATRGTTAPPHRSNDSPCVHPAAFFVLWHLGESVVSVQGHVKGK